MNAFRHLGKIAICEMASIVMAFLCSAPVLAGESPPSGLRSYRRDGVGQTLVEFHSPTIKKLYDSAGDPQKIWEMEGTTFILYRSTDGGKTWQESRRAGFGAVNGEATSDYGYAKPPDIGILPDDLGTSAENKARPAAFKIAQVFGEKEGKERQVFSEILSPSDRIKLEVSISGGRKDESAAPGESFILDPGMMGGSDTDQYAFCLGARMFIEDQDHSYPGCHFQAKWDGRAWHFWGKEDGRGGVCLPRVFGTNTLTVTGEGVSGGRGEVAMTVSWNPTDAEKKKAAAEKSVEDDEDVKREKASYEQVPARLAELQELVSQQPSIEKQRDLRLEMVKLEEVLIRLEEDRLKATRTLARAGAAAGMWNRAMEMANAYFQGQPAYIEKYLSYLDREREADLATRPGPEKEGQKAYLENFRKNMETNLWANYRRDLKELMQLADRAGDYNSFIAFAQKRESMLQSAKDQETSATARDLADLYGMWSRVAAELGGNVEQARSYWARAGNRWKMPWGPPEVSK